MSNIESLSVVAILKDIPEHGLVRGQVGTVVEILGPTAVDVEFSDDHGITYALVSLRSDELIRLHHSPLEQVA